MNFKHLKTSHQTSFSWIKYHSPTDEHIIEAPSLKKQGVNFSIQPKYYLWELVEEPFINKTIPSSEAIFTDPKEFGSDTVWHVV